MAEINNSYKAECNLCGKDLKFGDTPRFFFLCNPLGLWTISNYEKEHNPESYSVVHNRKYEGKDIKGKIRVNTSSQAEKGFICDDCWNQILHKVANAF